MSFDQSFILNEFCLNPVQLANNHWPLSINVFNDYCFQAVC
jgi:hypothetical protein